MTRPAPLHSYSFAEYLELEAASNTRHEFWNGEIYAMGGGSPEHAALAMAIGSALIPQLRGRGCRVFSSDLMVRVKSSGIATYPDVTVVCGALETDPQSPNTVTNPTILIEVLSDSTAAYDRSEKLEEYKTIESLEAVLLVSQTSRRIEVHLREERGFHTMILTTGQSLSLESIGARLDLDMVYQDAGL
ncbi:MAG: Uma2 family endonuclease [Myxococcota bacterium]